MFSLDRKIRVLIVDDSAMVRKILSDTVSAERDMEVVGTAPDPFVARDQIVALKPDVITLDIEMPRMDGLTFLKRLMHLTPIPTIIVSSLGRASSTAAMEALRCGAVEVLAKPAGPYSVGDLRLSLATKIRAAAISRPKPISASAPAPAPTPASASASAKPEASPSAPAAMAIGGKLDTRTIIAIGASTGGTVAIQEILTRLPGDMPPIVVTQHIPAGFSNTFASRLNKLCALEVREAVEGDLLQRGVVLIAPGGYHMVLRQAGRELAVELQQGPHVCYQRPSVDVMFASVARMAGKQSLGVLLTGMGSDGARGMVSMKQAGMHTIAQDEASCVVYGMPREAVRLGVVDKIVSLADIPDVLARAVRARGPAPELAAAGI